MYCLNFYRNKTVIVVEFSVFFYNITVMGDDDTVTSLNLKFLRFDEIVILSVK